MSFEDEMTFNSSHLWMITPGGLKLLFEYLSEFLLCIIVLTSTVLTTVGLMVYKLIIVKTSLITISIILVRNSTCPIKY